MIKTLRYLLYAIGIVYGTVVLSAFVHWHPYNIHEGEATWSIQGHDDAMLGCPHRYHEWIFTPNGERILLGCWGDDSNL